MSSADSAYLIMVIVAFGGFAIALWSISLWADKSPKK